MDRAEYDAMGEYAWAEAYEEYLNEAYDEPVSIAGYDYDVGRALRMVDPIAFRVGVSDYMDMIEQDLDEEDEEPEEPEYWNGEWTLKGRVFTAADFNQNIRDRYENPLNWNQV